MERGDIEHGDEQALATNRAWWDERVPLHLASEMYDVDRFRAEIDDATAFPYEELGDVAGARLVHLQCHIGLDTMVLARRGARVTGLDFSEPAIEAARRIAADLGASDARFVVGDVLDAPAAIAAAGIEPEFDVVFTGIGALAWLPDVERWADVVASLLAPGGRFYIAEFHPITDVLDDERGTVVVRDYFSREPLRFDEPGSYTDREAPTVANETVQWQHGLGEIVCALVRAGLRIDFLHEHPLTYFERFRALEPCAEGYRYPADGPCVPLMYSLHATKA
jgi:SAM-dependent methyltransferase